jgi:predicted sulfurtransferase
MGCKTKLESLYKELKEFIITKSMNLKSSFFTEEAFSRIKGRTASIKDEVVSMELHVLRIIEAELDNSIAAQRDYT